jgi:predicted permease
MFRARYRDFIRPDPKRELEDELRFHLDAETEALIAEGLSPEEARKQALARFGDVDSFLGECGASDRRRLRRKRRTHVLDALRQDASYALRTLLRRPAFTITALLVLALGIGANAAVLSVVDHIFLRPPALVRAPDEIKRVFAEWQRPEGTKYFQVRFSMPVARIIDSTVGTAFPSTIYVRVRTPVVAGASVNRSVMGAWVTPTYFSVLGVKLLAGRDFDHDDARLGVPPTSAIVSWSYWKNDLGADPSAIGRSIVVDGSPVTVRGIAPRGFTGVDLDVTDIWLPLGGMTAYQRKDGSPWYDNWGIIAFRVLARVPSGVDDRQLTARVEGALQIAARIRASATSPAPLPRVLRTIAAPILVSHGPEQISRSEAIAAALAGLALLLFVIAIANVGNLLLGRALDRRSELAVRLALGMSRKRLAGGVIVESTLLAIAASAAALMLAAWIGGVLRSMILPGAELATGPVDPRIALVTLGAALLAGLFASVVPLLAALRVDLVEMLKGTARSGGGRSRGRSMLVGLQVALSAALLAGTGLIAHSLYNIRTDDLGLDVDRGVIVLASESRGSLPLIDVERIVKASPGVTGAALTAEPPLFDQLGVRYLFTPGGDSIHATGSGFGFVAAEPSYLTVVGTKLLRGRNFTADDQSGAAPVMIASEEFARRIWPNKDPIGQCVRIDAATNPCYTVIGVAQNARVFDLVEEPKPVFYVPLEQRPDVPAGTPPQANALVIRTSADPAPLVARLRRLVADTGTTIRTRRVIGMSEVLAPRYEPWEFAARLFAGFAIVAIVLTIVGLNGVLTYLVSIRRRELGIRMALGASRGRVLGGILREGVAKIIAGAVGGVILSLLAARGLEPLLFQVSTHDPFALSAAVLIVLACAILASLLPALQAMKISPSSALRQE